MELKKVNIDGYYTKIYHNIKKLQGVTGRFTTDRKLVLSNLIQKYENLYESKGYTNHHIRKENAYHFHFSQVELCSELTLTKKGLYKMLQYLQDEGYINYFSTNKEGYIYKATYVLINIDFLNKKLDELNNPLIPTKAKLEDIILDYNTEAKGITIETDKVLEIVSNVEEGVEVHSTPSVIGVKEESTSEIEEEKNEIVKVELSNHKKEEMKPITKWLSEPRINESPLPFGSDYDNEEVDNIYAQIKLRTQDVIEEDKNRATDNVLDKFLLEIPREIALYADTLKMDLKRETKYDDYTDFLYDIKTNKGNYLSDILAFSSGVLKDKDINCVEKWINNLR